MTKSTRSVVVAAGLLSIVGVAALAQIGPLTPPAGPVADTEPSLVSIDDRLALIPQQFNRPPATNAVPFSGTGNIRITSDPVLIRSVILARSNVDVELKSTGGGIYAIIGERNAAAGRIELDIVASNGLEVRASNSFSGTIFFDPLPASAVVPADAD